jgi:hypothetical protein
MSVRINYIYINFSISSRLENIITCHLPHNKEYEQSEVKKEKLEPMVQTDFITMFVYPKSVVNGPVVFSQNTEKFQIMFKRHTC